MTDSTSTREIGNICNTYGSLKVKQDGGRFFWAIENWDGCRWEEIPEYLFLTLNRFEDDLQQAAREQAE
jgi:hypothetical protein